MKHFRYEYKWCIKYCLRLLYCSKIEIKTKYISIAIPISLPLFLSRCLLVACRHMYSIQNYWNNNKTRKKKIFFVRLLLKMWQSEWKREQERACEIGAREKSLKASKTTGSIKKTKYKYQEHINIYFHLKKYIFVLFSLFFLFLFGCRSSCNRSYRYIVVIVLIFAVWVAASFVLQQNCRIVSMPFLLFRWWKCLHLFGCSCFPCSLHL